MFTSLILLKVLYNLLSYISVPSTDFLQMGSKLWGIILLIGFFVQRWQMSHIIWVEWRICTLSGCSSLLYSLKTFKTYSVIYLYCPQIFCKWPPNFEVSKTLFIWFVVKRRQIGHIIEVEWKYVP